MADILTNSTVVNLDISIWTGKAKLQRTEVDDSNLPPEELVTLGSKKIFDPAKLKRFHGIKSNAFAFCNRYGVKFMSGWLVDNKYINELTDKLSAQRTLWDDEVQKFTSTYKLECDDWLAANPQWANILANALPRQSEITKRFNFGWQVYNIVPAPTNTNGDQTQCELDIIPTRAIEKMAKELEDAQEVYAPGKVFKASPLRRIARIAGALAFSSPEVAKLEELLNALANTGNLDIARVMLDNLANPKKLAALCAPSKTPQDIIDSIMPLATASVQPSPAPKAVPAPAPKPLSNQPLPDVENLIAGAQSVLHKQPVVEKEPVAQVNKPASVVDTAIEVLQQGVVQEDREEPEQQTDNTDQAINSMLGMIDSGGLW